MAAMSVRVLPVPWVKKVKIKILLMFFYSYAETKLANVMFVIWNKQIIEIETTRLILKFAVNLLSFNLTKAYVPGGPNKTYGDGKLDLFTIF